MTHGTAKSAIWFDLKAKNKMPGPHYYCRTPGRQRCGRCIIHLFWFGGFFTVSAAVFCFPVLLFPFIRLPVSSLGFSSIFEIPGFTTKITTVDVASPARPTAIKWKFTPMTCN
ncbi:MAG: hypothetical protein U5K27_12475 [Desulfotignum sp.]|nr:hypothetical protein [Desulfotignum sp.]